MVVGGVYRVEGLRETRGRKTLERRRVGVQNTLQMEDLKTSQGHEDKIPARQRNMLENRISLE